MSEDPKLFDAGDYNLYRYCHNDPLDLTDPMGLGEGPGIIIPMRPPPPPPAPYQMDHTPIANAMARRAFETPAKGEGSAWNLQKRAEMARIAGNAIGSHDYDRSARKDDFGPGTYKCNKFDYDVERAARVTPIMVRDNDTGRMRPATAGERATQQFENWRRLARSERQLGDEAAYAQQTRHASGHTGFIISDGHGGLTNVSAHERGVYALPGQFEKNPHTIYLRYTGD